ncbi:unnamed protein product, partial [Schistosoma curassoni]|uniref:Uncharacterized protein n=1 Tax=Schistosoma curassoni TaxID=6186 RepID=A0A183KVL2_9TREM
MKQIYKILHDCESYLEPIINEVSQSLNDTPSTLNSKKFNTIAFVEFIIKLIPRLIMLFTSLVPTLHADVFQGDLRFAGYWSLCSPLVWNPVKAPDIRFPSSHFRKQHPRGVRRQSVMPTFIYLFKNINTGTRRHQTDMRHINHSICVRARILLESTSRILYYNDCMYLAHECLTLGERGLYKFVQQFLDLGYDIMTNTLNNTTVTSNESNTFNNLNILERSASLSTCILVPHLRQSGVNNLLDHLRRERQFLLRY